MELKQYAHIVWKRIWIPVLLVVVAGIASLLNRSTPTVFYTMTMRFSVAVTPELAVDQYNFNGLHAWVTSEYMADTLSVLTAGPEFATYINANLAEAGSALRVQPDFVSAETEHRVLELSMSWGNGAELAEISDAVAKAVEENSLKYFPQIDPVGARVTLIDTLGPNEVVLTSRTQQLEVPIRVALALFAGVALTFLLDYLDDSVRGKSELEAMGISVLAEVPRK